MVGWAGGDGGDRRSRGGSGRGAGAGEGVGWGGWWGWGCLLRGLGKEFVEERLAAAQHRPVLLLRLDDRTQRGLAAL